MSVRSSSRACLRGRLGEGAETLAATTGLDSRTCADEREDATGVSVAIGLLLPAVRAPLVLPRLLDSARVDVAPVLSFLLVPVGFGFVFSATAVVLDEEHIDNCTADRRLVDRRNDGWEVSSSSMDGKSAKLSLDRLDRFEGDG